LAHQKKDDEQAIGRSKDGLSTKIHALVDALGNPLRFLLNIAPPFAKFGRPWHWPRRCCGGFGQ
jgi:hypothetical protein